MTAEQPALILKPLSQPQVGQLIEPLKLVGKGPIDVGRSSEADWTIPDQAVSRKHAQLTQKAGLWYLADLGSRHGTLLNGKPLEPGNQLPLDHTDLIQLGHWSCRCEREGARHQPTTTYESGGRAGPMPSRVQAAELAGLAQLRLDALIRVSQSFNSATSEEQIAEAIVEAVRTATGCERTVVVRQIDSNSFESLASTMDSLPRLSRSLIEGAANERALVELHASEGPESQAHSIIDLGIRTAVCAPIMAGDSVFAFLYLDTRDAESALPRDASAFCQSVAQTAGLSIQRLQAAALAERHAQLEKDLDAARRAQQLLMPAESGTFSRVSYSYQSLPGRIVAGDFFDILPLDANRVALFLGDVSGKGVGAAVLMAAAQSQLRTQLFSGRSIAEAMEAVNRDLSIRTESSKFVTMIAAVIDSDKAELELVNAGHGLFGVVSPTGEAVRIEAPPGFPVGVEESADYQSITFPFEPGSSVVFFSDGVLEQPNPAGEQFGFDRSFASIQGLTVPGELAAKLVKDVQDYAAGPLADDLTVAAITLT